MNRSFDKAVLMEISETYPEMIPAHIVDWWVGNKKNYMFVEDRSVGLATYEYPGLYSVHWFFTDDHRGRKAIQLAYDMLDALFRQSDAKAVRGLTKVELRAARWACRQLGLKSQGILEFKDGEYELFTLTKDEFYELKDEHKWAA